MVAGCICTSSSLMVLSTVLLCVWLSAGCTELHPSPDCRLVGDAAAVFHQAGPLAACPKKGLVCPLNMLSRSASNQRSYRPNAGSCGGAVPCTSSVWCCLPVRGRTTTHCCSSDCASCMLTSSSLVNTDIYGVCRSIRPGNLQWV